MPTLYEAQTIDISSHNSPCDFGKMASRGVSEVVIRATLRMWGIDTGFHDSIQSAISSGLLRIGAYHLWDSRYSAQKQIDNFCDTIQPYLSKISLLALDVEESTLRGATEMQRMRTWLWSVEARTGIRPYIYTSHDLWNNYHNAGPVAWAKCYPLWVMDYEGLYSPEIPTDWQSWALWQYSGSGNGAGNYYGAASGSLDLNVRNV